MKQNIYIAIDLKSFYASAECIDRKLDPLDTNLVVADPERTEKTICLAVSPSLKAYGIPGRARLFEVLERLREVNAARKQLAPGKTFAGKSVSAAELAAHPELEISFLTAVPRMAHYIDVSAQIYGIYLHYISPDDIHVYSIDEVLIDVTRYLDIWQMTPRELAKQMMRDVLTKTGITATAGIGTNLYLCKVAMDIMAKHIEADEDGMRIAELDEMSYRRQLWDHEPLTDFWRVGRGYAKKLIEHGIYTMGDVARRSLENEEQLYQMFGVNAELLIDHAWGWEPCTIEQIKAYRPESNSFSSGQVLHCAYDFNKARVVVHEMADAAALDLVEKKMVTDQMVLTVGYDAESLSDPEIRKKYHGEVTTDRYGRRTPKHAHGTANLDRPTASAKKITEAVLGIYDRTVDPDLLIRRITIATNHVVPEEEAERKQAASFEQLDLFTDYQARERELKAEEEALAKERHIQEAMLNIKRRYGKNAIIKGLNLKEGATGIDRNSQIGGHRS